MIKPIKRSIIPHIITDLDKKIVFINGPRQVGKTTLTKCLGYNYDYFNYDSAKDRLTLKECNWDRKKDLIIFDELHKMNQWKRWLKGIYDTEGVRPRMLVTGSSNLESYIKVGDSLAGRHFQYRLHPLDLKEVSAQYSTEDAFTRLWECGGFPEPFIDGTRTFYNRWKRSHLDIILKQDLLDIKSIKDIQAIETLIELLKNNIGSTVSYANLAKTLEKDAKTIKSWLQLLENLYIIFKVTPYNKKITRSILKEPKYYFYDHAQITKDDGLKLENIVACSLLKELHRLQDILGADNNTKLHFLRTKDGIEIDFLVLINNKPHCLIEVKLSDCEPCKHFFHFEQFFPKIPKFQLVKNITREKTYSNNMEIRHVIDWLINIDFSSGISC